jgi:hypothetical protein
MTWAQKIFAFVLLVVMPVFFIVFMVFSSGYVRGLRDGRDEVSQSAVDNKVAVWEIDQKTKKIELRWIHNNIRFELPNMDEVKNEK